MILRLTPLSVGGIFSVGPRSRELRGPGTTSTGVAGLAETGDPQHPSCRIKALSSNVVAHTDAERCTDDVIRS